MLGGDICEMLACEMIFTCSNEGAGGGDGTWSGGRGETEGCGGGGVRKGDTH